MNRTEKAIWTGVIGIFFFGCLFLIAYGKIRGGMGSGEQCPVVEALPCEHNHVLAHAFLDRLRDTMWPKGDFRCVAEGALIGQSGWVTVECDCCGTSECCYKAWHGTVIRFIRDGDALIFEGLVRNY